MIMPKRDDPRYIEIENFKDYELTNCIAYEMVIRNDEFAKTKKELTSINKKLSDLIHKRIDSVDSEFKEIYPKILKNLKREVFGDMSDENLYNVLKKQYFGDSRVKFKTSYCERIKELRLIALKKLNEAKEKFGLVIDENLLSWGQEISNTRKGEIDVHLHGIEKSTGKHIGLFEDRRHEALGVKTKDDIRESMSFTTLITSRPLLEFPKIKNTLIKLNMALPPKELTAYITEIKRQYDLDHTVIRTANEIFGSISILNDDTKDILVNGYARADMFYIYDCLKLGYTQRKIQKEVYNYYEDIGRENRTLSDKALRKYRDIANSMINNKGFKELVTGFKN